MMAGSLPRAPTHLYKTSDGVVASCRRRRQMTSSPEQYRTPGAQSLKRWTNCTKGQCRCAKAPSERFIFREPPYIALRRRYRTELGPTLSQRLSKRCALSARDERCVSRHPPLESCDQNEFRHLHEGNGDDPDVQTSSQTTSQHGNPSQRRVVCSRQPCAYSSAPVVNG